MAPLCAKSDLIRYLSRQGVVSHSDHDDSGIEDDEVIDDAIDRASAEITGNLYPLYADDDLDDSSLVKHWCVIAASYYLCVTRGNPVPDSVAHEYEQLTALPDGLLERTRRGKFVIPGLRRRSLNVPAFSNLTIDRRYRREKIRVIRANSSTLAASAIEQDIAPELNTDN